MLSNQVVVGSVNANRGHFEMAVRDLAAAEERWPGVVPGLISHRVPVSDAAHALAKRLPDEIKSVIRWAAP